MRLTIYSKPGCHLCDEMKAVIHRVIAGRSNRARVVLDDVDISDDPELLELYGIEIPVLLIDGLKVAKYRVSEEQLTRMLLGRGSKEP